MLRPRLITDLIIHNLDMANTDIFIMSFLKILYKTMSRIHAYVYDIQYQKDIKALHVSKS